MKISGLILLLFCISFRTAGQGTITVVMDSSISRVIDRYYLVESKSPQTDGYRIQLISRSGNNSKKEVNDLKAKFLSKHPDIPAYVIYQQPNFKLRIGDFRDRFSAYRFFRELKKEFPAAFLVRDKINFPVDEALILKYAPPAETESK